MKYDRHSRRRRSWLALATVTILLGLTIYSCSGPSKGTLAWYIDQLKPGMTEKDVLTLMPSDYFIAARSILPRAHKEEYPECRLMRCYADNTPVAWEHLYGDTKSTMGIANAEIYFSTNLILVGWRFTASGAEMPSGPLGMLTVRIVECTGYITNSANKAVKVQNPAAGF